MPQVGDPPTPTGAILTRVMVAGVILAAGASTRMGHPKALLPIGRSPETFVERLIRVFQAAGVQKVVVVAGRERPAIAALLAGLGQVQVTENRRPERGQLASLILALDLLTEHPMLRAVLVTPVDQPLVKSETVRRLVETRERSGGLIVRPVDGERHGHPVVFDRALFDDLRQADPEVGAKAVVAARRADVVEVAIADDEGAFTDIDTPAEYERIFGCPVPRWPG
jgi:molybdenum cofactor cytidylyltransferase